MTSAAQRVFNEALALPEEERQQLAEMLLDTVPAPDTETEEIERAWIEEAVRRAGEVERGEVEAVDGDEALNRLQEKLRKIHER